MYLNFYFTTSIDIYCVLLLNNQNRKTEGFLNKKKSIPQAVEKPSTALAAIEKFKIKKCREK
jgi:hypothetical protein